MQVNKILIAFIYCTWGCLFNFQKEKTDGLTNENFFLKKSVKDKVYGQIETET